MATTARNVSPGAALLRTSRLFSMPSPLSPPQDFAQATKNKSNTATTAHPTLLSVTTSHASRLVGDWGFKRPLPLKTTTNTTVPLIRVKKVDSVEAITDFQSASDHTMTLEKFQEMNLAISTPSNGSEPLGRSVFEEAGDVTAIFDGDRANTGNVRWKFRGPWLAGMPEGQFKDYISKGVNPQRESFRKFLRQRLALERTAEQAESAIDKGLETPPPVTTSDITDLDLTQYIRKLRDDRARLYGLVAQFLDLAPIKNEGTFHGSRLDELKPGHKYDLYKDNPYAVKGTPITHPSAGLSYLRTTNYMDNHPVYGPQGYHPPVKARVLKPKNEFPHYQPILGVGGFVHTETEKKSSFNNDKIPSDGPKKQHIAGLFDLDLKTPGGAKVYVQVEEATIDSKGRVRLQLQNAHDEQHSTLAGALLVQKELVGEADALTEAVVDLKQKPIHERPTEQKRLQKTTVMHGSSRAYGLGPGPRRRME